MKLFYSPTSPYVRKVLAVAHEKGLTGQIQLVTRDPSLDRLNPLNKIPTLVTDDNEVLIESALICQYLDEIGGGRKLYPTDSKARRRMLQLEALGHGVCDAGVLLRMESRMHKPEQMSAEWLERQQKKLQLGLKMQEQSLDELGSTVTPAHITYGVTLFFFEHPTRARGGRDANPKLATWYDAFARVPCMATTEPAIA